MNHSNTQNHTFKSRILSIIIGGSGTGKTRFIQQNAKSLDSKNTVIIDYGKGMIWDYETQSPSKDKYFPQSTYVDIQNTLNLSIDEPTLADTKTLIIDEGCYIFSQRRIAEKVEALKNAVQANDGEVIIIFQHEDDLKMIDKYAKNAASVEEIGKIKILSFQEAGDS